MNKSIIVYGPQGCGKTRYAERIAKHFGLEEIRDEGKGDFNKGTVGFFQYNHLYLCNEPPKGIPAGYIKSFAEVARQINDAIPLTEWRSGPPPMVGEYNADDVEDIDSFTRRWWDGNSWSLSYDSEQSEMRRNWTAKIKTDHAGIKWRGLSEEPIIVRGAA